MYKGMLTVLLCLLSGIVKADLGASYTSNGAKQHPDKSYLVDTILGANATTFSDSGLAIALGYNVSCSNQTYQHARSGKWSRGAFETIMVRNFIISNTTDHESQHDGYKMDLMYNQLAPGSSGSCIFTYKGLTQSFRSSFIKFLISGAGIDFTINSESSSPSVERDLSTLNRNFVLTRPIPVLCQDPIYCTPIVIDLGRNGFKLGGKGIGVMFDFSGTGDSVYVQWVRENGDEAFLAADLNDNGIIDDGSELFGSGTRMLLENNALAANGFIGLSQYDLPTLGDNDDGFITADDAIWSKLKLWNDIDANGLSEYQEVQPINSSGITRLEIIPKSTQRHDSAGNWYAFKATAFEEGASKRRVKYSMVDVAFYKLQ